MWITHRCTNCHTPDVWKQRDPRNPTVAGTKCCTRAAWNPPELMRRWDTTTNQEILIVIEPGGTTGTMSVTSCTCDDCHQLYQSTVEASA
jgi:hypothetical protein